MRVVEQNVKSEVKSEATDPFYGDHDVKKGGLHGRSRPLGHRFFRSRLPSNASSPLQWPAMIAIGFVSPAVVVRNTNFVGETITKNPENAVGELSGELIAREPVPFAVSNRV